MKKIYSFLPVIFCLFSVSIPAFSQNKAGFKIVKKIKMEGDGKWDFVTLDKKTNRLYVPHGTELQVLDLKEEKVIGVVKNTPGIHGIALVPSVNRGFTSNGKDSTITVFDLTTFATVKTIKVKGTSPDHIIYDVFSKYVFDFNNKSSNVSVIDPVTEKVVKDLPLGGKPELAVSDNNGIIYVNLEDTHEIAVIDAKALHVLKKWSLAPGTEPTGLAFDAKNHRLFSGCANKLLVVTDSETGKVVTTLPIGGGVDGVAFDPMEKLIFTSNGSGTVTVIHQEDKDKYTVVENVPTKTGAKTLAYDESTHTIYIPSADFTQLKESEKPTIIPGTFGILVLKK
jgi:YVTN family beta-propeller protein